MQRTTAKEVTVIEWEDLLEAPLQVKLGQLLKLVPNFHKALVESIMQNNHKMGLNQDAIQEARAELVAADSARATDTRIPECWLQTPAFRKFP